MKKYGLTVIFLCCLLLFTPQVQAKNEPEPVVIAGLKVAVWLPGNMKGAPVIIFSHGFKGCATQSVFLAEALAKAGYAVFAPNHQDAICYGGRSHWLSLSQIKFDKPDEWNDKTYADRKSDIESLIESLPADPRYKDLDWHNIGLAGHSLGGYTALGIAGAWPSWRDKRIKAVLALSPYAAPYLEHDSLKNIHVPVMYQGGSRDTIISPLLRKKDGVYDKTPAPKYFVDFEGAGHLDWTDMFTGYQVISNRYSIAFFDTAMRKKPFPRELAQKSDKADVQIDTGK